MASNKKELIFHYIKTNNYKTYYADGIFGGITPKGKLYMEPFIERGATPRQVKHTLMDDGSLDSGTIVEGKKDIIREIECGILMDIENAKALRDWLNSKIEEFETIDNKINIKESH